MAVIIAYDDYTFGQCFKDTSGNQIYVERGDIFKIIMIEEDVDSGEVYYTVECKKLGEPSTFMIPKSKALDVNLVKKYAIHGLDVNDSNRSIVPEVFQLLEDQYIEDKNPVGLVHSESGVKKVEDENGDSILVYAGNSNPITGSEYIGRFDLEPKGSRETWFKLAAEMIKKSVEVAFVLSVAFAAILLGVLKGEAVDVDNIIVHLRGDSSSGKTTMLNLAISVFGNPNEHCANGLISTWNATANALLRRLMSKHGGRGGNLFGLDEFSMLNVRDCSNLIYSVASGIERDRLTRDARCQDRLTGNYIVLSTGEASILSKTNGNMGLAMRVLEMDNQCWTKDSEMSEKIKSTVKKNYGFAAENFGLKLGRWIQTNSMDALIERFEGWRNYYIEHCDIQKRKERISSRYALILLAADMCREFFDFEMDCEAICKFIIENENANSEEREGYGGLYDKMIAYIVGNQSHFIVMGSEATKSEECKKREKKKRNTANESNVEIWGRIEPLDTTKEVAGKFAQSVAYIAFPFFERITTREFNCEDPKAIRKWLKKEGLSLCEPDRDYIRKTFEGVTTKYVAVYLPGEVDRGLAYKKGKVKELFRVLPSQFDICKLTAAKESIEELLDYKDILEPSQKKELRKHMETYNKLEEEAKVFEKIKLSIRNLSNAIENGNLEGAAREIKALQEWNKKKALNEMQITNLKLLVEEYNELEEECLNCFFDDIDTIALGSDGDGEPCANYNDVLFDYDE